MLVFPKKYQNITSTNMAMDNKDFAVFILTHGRPDNVLTLKTLAKCGYTGKIFIIIDDEDETADRYIENFGDKVVVFSKEKIAQTFDQADNFKDRRSIVYARNASFEIAKDLGITYFMQLDDDYTSFSFSADEDYNYITKRNKIKNLDGILDSLLEFYKVIPAKTIAMAQGGDFIGGECCSVFKKKLARKAMNSFICSTKRPFKFVGRINEDVNTYTWYQSLGNIFFTVAALRLNQVQTQLSKGGMSDIYLDNGTYIKSFYTVIFSPSSVKVALMGHKDMRLHHRVRWDNAVPKIIDEKYKK